ncbi:hypothetical protein D3C81_1922930 [compost metagenome]
MIRLGLNAVALKVISDVLSSFLQGHVDDARLPRTLGHPLDQPPALVLATYRFDQQIEVGPVETGGHHIVSGDSEFGLHVGDDFRCCGGRQ